MIGSVIDRLLQGQPFAGLFAWLLGLLVGRAALTALGPVLTGATTNRVQADLRSRILDAAMRVGPWTGRRTGETVTKATEGVEAVGALAGVFLPQLFAGMSIPLILGLVVVTVDWPTAIVMVLVLPLAPLLLRLMEKRFASVSARYRATADRLASRFLDGIQGLRTLKTLDRADSYGDEIAKDSERLRSETMGLLRVNQLALLGVDTLFTMGTVVAAASMAAIRLQAGAISAGESVSIVLLGVMLIEPLTQIGRFFYVGAVGRAGAAQIEELLASETSSPQRIGGTHVGSVRFEDVHYRYPDGTEAISSVDFEIEPGERVALVGPSGSGKTTIAHLVLGLLEPTRGLVRTGGGAVLVPQRPYLFYGTVADNLRLAKPDASDNDLWSSLQAAQLDTFLRERSSGLETHVGERGLSLSGGEVQRLAIARALLVDAPIVVLDEPTSNIDLDSEARLRVALGHLTRGRTVIIIAHRRSTITGASRALVLENGRLVDDMADDEIGRLFDAMTLGGNS